MPTNLDDFGYGCHSIEKYIFADRPFSSLYSCNGVGFNSTLKQPKKSSLDSASKSLIVMKVHHFDNIDIITDMIYTTYLDSKM